MIYGVLNRVGSRRLQVIYYVEGYPA